MPSDDGARRLGKVVKHSHSQVAGQHVCDVNCHEDGYTTKDSGQREQFDSGAIRDVRSGKGRFDLISMLALGRIAGVYERGAVKYSDRNWEQGIPISRNIDSALRHVAQFMLGADDEDHLAQAAWNLIAALHFDEGIKRGIYDVGLDDRPHYPFATHDPDATYHAEREFGTPELKAHDHHHDEFTERALYHPKQQPMKEVEHSSTEQWHSQTVLHDQNHSESEGSYHYHDDKAGVAYSTKPADWRSKPHRHPRAA